SFCGREVQVRGRKSFHVDLQEEAGSEMIPWNYSGKLEITKDEQKHLLDFVGELLVGSDAGGYSHAAKVLCLVMWKDASECTVA
ncbi:hypothetical protein AVEN_236711-1, partial [Araneus ventricosus]